MPSAQVLGLARPVGQQKEHTILISAPYMMPHMSRFIGILESFGFTVIVADVFERLSEEELLNKYSGFDAIICGDDHFTEAVYKANEGRLKVVSKWGTGIDSLNPSIAPKYGAVVINTPGAFTEPVSDSCLAYILAFARQFVPLDRLMKDKIWSKIKGHTLGEKTVGIIGVGDIGKRVMTKCRSFGCKMIGHDIVDVDKKFLEDVGAEQFSLER